MSLNNLLVVADVDHFTCPVCLQRLSASSTEAALRRGHFVCDAVQVRVVSVYTINEQVLT